MSPAPHVQWKTLEELEGSLLRLRQVYSDEPAKRQEVRAAVIRTKDRARAASRNPKVSPAKRSEKDEMVKWMLVWLDDPAIFADWVTLRRTRLNGG